MEPSHRAKKAVGMRVLQLPRYNITSFCILYNTGYGHDGTQTAATRHLLQVRTRRASLSVFRPRSARIQILVGIQEKLGNPFDNSGMRGILIYRNTLKLGNKSPHTMRFPLSSHVVKV